MRMKFPIATMNLGVAVLLLSGCGKSEPVGTSGTPPADASKAKKITVGFLVKMPEEPWFQNEWKFADKAGAKYNLEVLKIGVPDGEKVLTAIDSLATKGAQGFVICTPDVRLGPAIVAKAKAQNLKVFAVDDRFVGADGNPMDVPYMGISARKIGELVGKSLYDEMTRRGWKIDETAACTITHDELQTVKDRTDGATDALIAAGFPKDKIFRATERTTDQEGAFNAANVTLTQHPEVKRWLVFSVNDEGVLGTVRAMEGRGFTAENVLGIGIGGSTALAEFRKPNATGFWATALLSPMRHGFETTELLYKWIKDGVEPPKTTYTSATLITRDNFENVMREQGQLE